MSRAINAILLSGALIAGVSLAAQAAPEEFVVDKEHTSVVFLVNHLGYSRVIGRFNDFSGEFTFDDTNFANSKASFVINTRSIDTNHQKRDDHLRSPDFFNVREFPTMTFTSAKVEKTGERTARTTGNLTLLGVTKPITLNVTFNKKAEHPLPEYNRVTTAGFSMQGKLKRSDFGMKYGLPGLGDEIELMIETEGHKKK